MRKMRFKTKFYIFLYLLVAAATVVGIMASSGAFNAQCAHLNTTKIEGKAATCLKAGLSDGKKCTDCGEIIAEQKEIPALGHVEKKLAAVAPTCSAPGKTAGVRCDRENCRMELVPQVSIAPLVHTPVASGEQDATCTEPGSVGGTHCKDCFITIEAPMITTPPTGHSWVDVPATESTCAVHGHEAARQCSECGEFESELVELPLVDCAEEDLVVLPSVPASCTRTGWTEGVKCSVCDKIHVEQEVAPIDPDAHNYSVLVAEQVDSDCATKTNGTTAVYECLYCHDAIGGDSISWEHDVNGWTESFEATDEHAGEEYGECTHCHSLISRTIPKLPAEPDPEATEEDIFNEENDIDPDGIV